ncbi:FAD-linked oxidase C-terminal domain-containing protein, partial [Nocardioides sp. P5_C9_2]
AAHRWVVAPVDSPGRALTLAQSVVHSQVVPAAVEVDWAGGAGTLAVLVEGRPDSVTARVDAVRRLLGPDASETDDEPAGGATYPWDVTSAGDARSTALKLTCVLSGVADVLAAAEDGGVAVRGSAGSGVLYGSLDPGTPADDVRSALARLREVCTRHGGTAVVVDAPAAVKAAVDVWGPIPALDLMRRVKDQFDPDHRLSPGRFVGGI